MNDAFPVAYWTSLGLSEDLAAATVILNEMLLGGVSELRRLGQAVAENATKSSIKVGTAASALPGGLPLFPDDTLLPMWERFAEALIPLASLDNVSVGLTIYNVQLPKQVLSILEPALKNARLDHLMLVNIVPPDGGFKSIERLIVASRHVNHLFLSKNTIDWRPETTTLLNSLRLHTHLQGMHIKECGINRLLQIEPEFAPALLNLEAITLTHNNIGRQGAHLITDCLATNPHIKVLDLDSNILNDDYAALFERSLRSNTNLKMLRLSGNHFTSAGIKILYRSIFDDQSLNAINDSNHTCKLVLFSDSDPVPMNMDESVLLMNSKVFEMDTFPESAILRCSSATGGDTVKARKMLCIEGRKKMKILHALMDSDFNTQYIKEDFPLKLMPKVIAFIQESGRYSESVDGNLDRLFQVIRSRRDVTSFMPSDTW